MLFNYLKIALRTILKHKGFSFITIVGLAIGFACTMLILLLIQEELSFDRFHEKGDRIYRVTTGTANDGQPTNANGQIGAGPALKASFPEIEAYVRFRKMGWNESRAVTYGEQHFSEPGLLFVDSSFFDLFSFRLLEGNPRMALVAPFSVVLTKSIAEKYFGSDEALGKIVRIDAYNNGTFSDYMVTAVVEDVPSNSHIRFDLLASFSSLNDTLFPWSLEAVYTYVLMRPGTRAPELETKLPAFLRREVQAVAGRDPWFTLHLQALNDIRLYSRLRADFEPNGTIGTIYAFAAIAFVILLIACINFMNLSTAHSLRRAREVGMRKVLGARRTQLIGQFLGEAILQSLFALLAAFALVEALLPLFNRLAGRSLDVAYPHDLVWTFVALALALFVGLLAGSYPAFVLSGFRPLVVLKGILSRGSKSSLLLRRGLVVFQFAVTIVLLVCTGATFRQMEYIHTLNLGFDREQLLILPFTNQLRQTYASFRTELLSRSGILGAAATEEVPGRAGNGSAVWVGGSSEKLSPSRFFVDQRFVKTFGLHIVAGRDFSEEHQTDATDAFLVNETFVRARGWTAPQEAVGKRIELSFGGTRYRGTIVGVINDFHSQSLHEPIGEMVLKIMPLSNLNFVAVRITPGESDRVLEVLRSLWQAHSPGYPFQYRFLDQDFDQVHRSDEQMRSVFSAFAVLAAVTAALGLFGLASFTVEQRRKEIGIRKVLGASVPGIFGLLSREFVGLVLAANLLAWPVAWYVVQRWLESFAYRADIGLMTFMVSGALALLIALMTVSYQAISAAMRNPVDALRYE